MIKGMVVRNIEQHHVIVVMTLTAMDDLENQVWGSHGLTHLLALIDNS